MTARSLHRGFWTPDKRQKLRVMWRMGIPDAEIIDALGLHAAGRNALENAIKRYVPLVDRTAHAAVCASRRCTQRSLKKTSPYTRTPPATLPLSSWQKQQLSLSEALPAGHPVTLLAFKDASLYPALLQAFGHTSSSGHRS